MYNRNLIDYLPFFLRNINEYQAILKYADEPEIKTLWKNLENALNDQFILNSTEYGVLRREKILGIIPKGTATLDERKFTILTRLNEQLPYTLNSLKNQLNNLCGRDNYTIRLDNDNYLLEVLVELTARNNFIDVENLLKRIIPANMIINLKLKYNQYLNLEEFRHVDLERFTHEDIRNEVLYSGD